MNETVDGDYQNYKAKGGAFTREHFSAKARARGHGRKSVDADIMNLNRGGHDPFKVYAAYHSAVHHEGEPTSSSPKP
jgi:pyruvate dehydrogenase E1 component